MRKLDHMQYNKSKNGTDTLIAMYAEILKKSLINDIKNLGANDVHLAARILPQILTTSKKTLDSAVGGSNKLQSIKFSESTKGSFFKELLAELNKLDSKRENIDKILDLLMKKLYPKNEYKFLYNTLEGASSIQRTAQETIDFDLQSKVRKKNIKDPDVKNDRSKFLTIMYSILTVITFGLFNKNNKVAPSSSASSVVNHAQGQNRGIEISQNKIVPSAQLNHQSDEVRKKPNIGNKVNSNYKPLETIEEKKKEELLKTLVSLIRETITPINNKFKNTKIQSSNDALVSSIKNYSTYVMEKVMTTHKNLIDQAVNKNFISSNNSTKGGEIFIHDINTYNNTIKKAYKVEQNTVPPKLNEIEEEQNFHVEYADLKQTLEKQKNLLKAVDAYAENIYFKHIETKDVSSENFSQTQAKRKEELVNTLATFLRKEIDGDFKQSCETEDAKKIEKIKQDKKEIYNDDESRGFEKY